MTWTLLLVYALHQGDNVMIGSFSQKEYCINAMHHINPEMRPDAMVCIYVKKEVLE